MRFVVSFDIDNEAFGETFDDARPEIASILTAIAEHVEGFTFQSLPGHRKPIQDSNGNRIGFFGLIEDGGS